MSRIFDALRRVEQLKNETDGIISKVELSPSLDILKPYSPRPDGLAKMERVSFRPSQENHVLGNGDKDRAGLERFRLLRYRLHRLREQRPVRSVVIASAVPEEGKSMVAANLAATLAQASARVILIDADLRRPSLHTLLGLKASEGLADFLRGRVEFLRACRQVDPLGFAFLGAGRTPANPVELLQGESMRSLVKSETTSFDWVVIDSPPVLSLADTRILATLCDAVIVVTREGHTRREELQECLAALKDTYIAGIVLNRSNLGAASAYSYLPSTEATGDVLKHSSHVDGHFARS